MSLQALKLSLVLILLLPQAGFSSPGSVSSEGHLYDRTTSFLWSGLGGLEILEALAGNPEDYEENLQIVLLAIDDFPLSVQHKIRRVSELRFHLETLGPEFRAEVRLHKIGASAVGGMLTLITLALMKPGGEISDLLFPVGLAAAVAGSAAAYHLTEPLLQLIGRRTLTLEDLDLHLRRKCSQLLR